MDAVFDSAELQYHYDAEEVAVLGTRSSLSLEPWRPVGRCSDSCRYVDVRHVVRRL